MESQPQNPEFRNNPKNFHLCILHTRKLLPEANRFCTKKQLSPTPSGLKDYIRLYTITIERVNEPWHEISNNVVCATSKASDQPAHTRSLIRAFASRLNIL